MDNHNKDDSSSSSPIPPSASSRSPASAVAPPPVFPKRYLIIIAIIVAVAILILFTIRYTTGTFNPFFVVASDSMVPTLQVGDLLIIQHAAASDVDSPASYENLKVGDIILFKNPHVVREDTREPMTIVHRLEQINTTTTTTVSEGGAAAAAQEERILKTKGDHNPASIPKLDYPFYKSYYIGKVIHVIPQLGILFLPAYNSWLIATGIFTTITVFGSGYYYFSRHKQGKRKKK